ncbi:MAG: 50S ribosomal protein L15 [Chlamydiae bacterium]|nr:50S ribosomal protein L15 [Chlamydiota bacterium]
MTTLSTLKNTHRYKKKVQRVGRGPGSKRGKTSCRGTKGSKARSGYKRRLGQEGGQLPLFRKLPTRGFSNARFRIPVLSINLSLIEERYSDGETVNFETLRQKGLAPRTIPGGIKILGQGELKKKVSIEAHRFSASAKAKLEKNKISYVEIPLKPANKA